MKNSQVAASLRQAADILDLNPDGQTVKGDSFHIALIWCYSKEDLEDGLSRLAQIGPYTRTINGDYVDYAVQVGCLRFAVTAPLRNVAEPSQPRYDLSTLPPALAEQVPA